MDQNQKLKEVLRWRIMQTLNVGRPYPVGEDTILATVAGDDMPITPLDLRREMDYLEDRKLVCLTGKNTPIWAAELTHYGVDVVEYTLECHPGIARPPKYW
jgi:hypothetical protein